MKEVFYVAGFYVDGLQLIGKGFDSYKEAFYSIDDLPNGTYQIQKVFVKES
jgi:hypothetical protein